MFYNDAKNEAIKRLKDAETEYNSIGERGNQLALNLYGSRKSASKAIDRIEKYINTLANSPKEFAKEVASIKLNIGEFNEAMKIEAENSSNNLKGGAMAGGGVAVGGGIATLGPTAAMAIATTFGTASTGTAIASLSGAAATKAALAWLGGGALAAGGGGMAAGNALLALAGPIGWSIAGTLIVGGSVFSILKNKKAAEKAQKAAKEIRTKIAVLKPKVKRLESLLSQTDRLKTALSVTEMVNLYPSDYLQFSVEQKEKLAALINNAKAMGQLINERVS
jgi:hypothetical protein